MATVSYVRITTSNGTVLSGDGAAWTPVTGLSFGATQSYASNSGGGTGAGNAKLGDLSFALSQSSSLSPTLKQILASGQAVKVEVATYDTGAAAPGSVGMLQSYDVFGNVAAGAGVAGLHTETLKGGTADVYTVTPGSVSEATYSNGAQVAASAFSTTTNTAVTPAAAPADVAAGTIAPGTAPGQSGLTYYVEFKGASGNYLTGANGSTWFAVTGLSSGLEQTINIGPGSTGTGAGKVGFDPASFALADASVAPALFAAEASGKIYSDVQIEAVGSNGKVVDSTTLGTVGISAITQAGAPRVTLQYGSYDAQHVSANGAVTNSMWNTIYNKENGGVAPDPIVQLNTGSATQVPATTNFVSFVPYSGSPAVPGDPSVAAPGGAGSLAGAFPSGKLIAATGVAFDTKQTLNIGSQNSGAGAGKVAFDPLTLTVAATPASAVLDSYLFTGKPFQQVYLGTATASTTTEKDDFKLVAIATDALDLVAGTHSLGLQYGALAEQTAATASNGVLTTGVPQGWNRIINTADNTDAPIAQGTGSASPPAAVKVAAVATPSSPSNPNVSVAPAAAGSGAQAPAPTTNTAYVQFRDASGNVITAGPNGASWFKLSSASASLERSVNLGAQNTTVGGVTFDPLSLSLGPDAITAQLDKTFGASGGITAEVASYSGNTLLNDYVFGGASLKTDAPSTTGSALTFNYTGFQETPYASGVASQPVTWSTATNSSAFSAKTAAPASATPPVPRTPTQLTTYAEFVGADGKLITGSNGKTLFATRNVSGGELEGPTNGGALLVDPLSLSLGDDAVVSALEGGLGSTAAPVGVVLVSVDAQNPKNVVSQQTYGDVYLQGDTLDNAGGDHSLTFASAAGSGAAYNGTLAPAGYTEQIADDYRPDGATGYSTAAGGALPNASVLRGLPPGPTPAYQSYTGESFSAEVSTADGATNLTGTASNGFLSASSVKVDMMAKTGSFSVSASALPGLTKAVTSGQAVLVGLQAVNGQNTEGLTFGGGGPTSAAVLTGASLDAATGLADVTFKFSGTPVTSGSGSGGGVLGADTYQDQLMVAPEPLGPLNEVTFDVSFTNGLAPTSDLTAADLQFVKDSGDVSTNSNLVVSKQSDGTYQVTVFDLSGSGTFSIDGTPAFKANGVANHTLSAALQSGSVSVTTNADGTQSFTVAAPNSPTTTTTYSSSGFGFRTGTVVTNPDPSTAQVTTTYDQGGSTVLKTESLLTNGADVVVTPGTATDPAGVGGTTTDTYASPGGALLTDVSENAAGTPVEKIDHTGSGTVTTVYAADGTTPASVTTVNPDGSGEVYETLPSGPYASSDTVHDANGDPLRATYTRAGGVVAEIDTFGADGSKTVALFDPTGAPLETVVTKGDGTSSVTQFVPAGPSASITTTYDASGKATGQTQSPRNPDVALDGTGGAVTTPTVTVAGSIDIPGVAGTVQLSVNGAAAGAPVALNADGSFSAVLPFAANGTYDVTATATTAAGGVGVTAAPVEYTVSDIAPTLAFTGAPTTGASADRTITGLVTASGTAVVAGQAVTLTEDGVALATAAPVTVAADGTFSAGVVLPDEGANAIQASVVDSLGNAAVASITETLDQVAPVVSSPTLTVAPGAGPTAVGIAAPADDVSAPGALVITVGALPTDGTLTLADGRTAVTAGMTLTAAQLGGILFTPTAGLADQTSAFTYAVADGAGNASTGIATLAIGDPVPVPPAAASGVPAAPTAPPAIPAASTTSPASTAPATSPSPVAPASSLVPATSSAPAAPPASSTLPAPVTTANADRSSTTTVTNPDGTTTATTSGGSRFDDKPYSAVADSYAIDGTLLNEVRSRNDGRTATSVYQGGQTLASPGFGLFYNNGAPSSTFVFDPGDGRDVVSLFRVDGTDHDTLSFKGSDYGNSIATVLNHSRDTAAGLLITDPVASSPGPGGHDTVLLKGITKGQLAQNRADIVFHA